MSAQPNTKAKKTVEETVKLVETPFDSTAYQLHNTRFTPQQNNQFTGIARSVVCFDHNGFKNFRIVELHIQEGKVVKTAHSDPFVAFEASAKLEVINDHSTLNINSSWVPGKAWAK